MPATLPPNAPRTSMDSGNRSDVEKSHRRRMVRRINARLAVGTIAVIGSVVVAGYFWHSYQQQQAFAALKQRAISLEEKGQWDGAAQYWQRYLWLKPNDFEAHVRLTEAFEKGMSAPSQRRQLSKILNATIGLAADHPEETQSLHVRKAANLLELHDYLGALQEANEWLNKGADGLQAPANSADAAALRRIWAIAACAVATEDGQLNAKDGSAPGVTASEKLVPKIEDAAKAIDQALADQPGDVQLASTAAAFFRVNASKIPGGREKNEGSADRFMDALVKARSDDADALVLRYKYRAAWTNSASAGDVQSPISDLEAALRLQPRHYEALILHAAANAESDSDGARRELLLAIEEKPKTNTAYLALAQLEATKGNLDKAEATLQDAYRAIGNQDIDLGRSLAYVLIQNHKLDDAANRIQDLDRAIQSQIPQLGLSIANRRALQNQLNLLRGRLAIARAEYQSAVVPLKAVISPADQAQGDLSVLEVKEAKTMLAAVMEQLGNAELAAEYWVDLSMLPLLTTGDGAENNAERVRLKAQFREAAECMRRAGGAYFSAGEFDSSIQQLERYFRPPSTNWGEDAWLPADVAWVQLLKSHLAKQLELRAEERDWGAFSSALTNAKKLEPPQLDVCMAEFEYEFALQGDQGSSKANAVLKSGEGQFKDKPEFWRYAVTCYQRLNQPDDAEKAISHFNSLEKNPSRRAVIRALYEARNKDFAAADRTLTASVKAAAETEKPGLQLLRTQLLVAAGSAKQALSLVTELKQTYRNDQRIAVAGIQTAFAAEDYALAKKWVDDFDAAYPAESISTRIWRARLRLAEFGKLSPTERTSLGAFIANLRELQPNSKDVVTLSAHYADLSGNPQLAQNEYEKALKLGSNNPALITRLVELLLVQGETTRADHYLARISTGSTPASPETSILEVAAAAQRNDFAEAIKLAREGAALNPDDPVRPALLANLLWHDGNTDEAEKLLRDAIARFPKDVRCWTALFTLLQRGGQADKAAKFVDDFTAGLDANWSEGQLAAARAYQMLGKPDRAVELCETAVKADPRNVAARLALARFLTSIDLERAAAEYAEVLNIDKNQGFARRQLAILLALSGNEERRLHAAQLIDESESRAGTLDALKDNRVRAALLSLSGKDRKAREKNIAEARKLIAQQVEAAGPDAADLDRLLLARFCELEAWLCKDLSLLQTAREQLQNLARRDRAQMPHVIEYCEFLLRELSHAIPPEVDKSQWLPLWNIFSDDALALSEDLAQRYERIEADDAAESNIGEALGLMGYRVMLLHKAGRTNDAVVVIDQFQNQHLAALESKIGQPRAWLTLGKFYSSVERHDAAEGWYRRLITTTPEAYSFLVRELLAQDRTKDAVEVCLQAANETPSLLPGSAALLAQLMSAKSFDSETAKQIDHAIASALESQGDNVELLLSVAVLNVTRGNDAEAIRLFRRVVELSPGNSLALNNLATLLAEQPSQVTESRELIERAITASGRQPGLLDTLGTIQMRTGKIQEAIASLEEAVAGGSADARHYFHLAAAYDLASRSDEAQVALSHAQSLGLEDQILTEGDQQLLQRLKKKLGSSSVSPSVEAHTQDGKFNTSANTAYSSVNKAG